MVDVLLARPEAPKLTAPRSILVVDDEPDILDSLRAVIERYLPGAKVLPATNGRQALELLKTQHVDLVVSDFKMPGMNGLELLAEVRDSTDGIPRILMTAFPAVGLAVRAVNEAKIDSFFVKPFDGLKLVEAIRTALEESHAGIPPDLRIHTPYRLGDEEYAGSPT